MTRENNTGGGPDDRQLDALLRRAAPTPTQGEQADLVARILAASERAPRLTIVNSPTARAPAPLRVTPDAGVVGLNRRAGLAGLLAASLLLGVLLGQAGVSDRALTGLENATGLTLTLASLDLAADDLETVE
jgi:hypothetical protein